MGNFSMLSVNLISNILTRLPTESVLDYSAGACDGKCTFLFLNNNPIQAYIQFHYLELYDNEYSSSEEQPCHRVTRIKLNPAPFKYYSLTGSCNGLVCLYGCPDDETVSYEPALYICNPITRECVSRPEFEKKSGRGQGLLTGFGYVSKTNEYKVIRVYNLLEEPNFVHVEVYTLGSGKGWRKTGGKFKENLDSFVSIRAVFVNVLEFLCWQLKDGRVLAFDLSCETIYEIPTSCGTPWQRFRLGVLGGCLSATHLHKDSDTYHVMVLKKKTENGPFTWIVEFRLQENTNWS
ncbi:uncharacterized protein LOC113291056 [Papaver somniferum]|uniref:uncharacterized protein LOC113291056 n=1 Tax=Papaver somniferum TaxID=3469 RepID=UPI000E704BDB|nr:uncharacterized protein LOC113291056 [Papaver somniferum]